MNDLNARRAILWIVLVTSFALVSRQIDNASGEQTVGARWTGASTVNVETSDRAPAGTYTASTGASAGTASSTGPRGRARGAAAGEGTTSGAITLNIDGYSTKEEVDQIVAAQGSGAEAMLQAVNKTSHGTVTIGGHSFMVNMAASVKAGSSYNIYMVSARPFSTGTSSGGGSSVMGGSAGYIQLTVNSSGSGEGKMYTSTQIVVEKDGSVLARGGASTATVLTNVTRQELFSRHQRITGQG